MPSHARPPAPSTESPASARWMPLTLAVRLTLLGALAISLFTLSAATARSSQPATPQSMSRPARVGAAASLPPRRTQTRATRSRPAAPRPATGAPRPATTVPRPTAPRAAAAWVRPSPAAIVSPYGPRWGGFHAGIDFGAAYGTAIRAVGDGVVVGTGYLSGEGGYGQLTLIQHGDGVTSAYAHQSRIAVRVGDRVTAGQVIGYIGSTGHSTGPHLHFEIRTRTHGGQINPATWLRDHGVSV